MYFSSLIMQLVSFHLMWGETHSIIQISSSTSKELRKGDILKLLDYQIARHDECVPVYNCETRAIQQSKQQNQQ